MKYEDRAAVIAALNDEQLVTEFVRRCQAFRDAYWTDKDHWRREYQEVWAECHRRGISGRAQAAWDEARQKKQPNPQGES